MKLLLTGATGFVGRNILLQALKEKRYEEIILPIRDEVKLARQFTVDGYPKIPTEVTTVMASAGEWKLQGLRVEHVIHCAGVLFARSKAEYFDTNVKGTLRLFKEIAQPQKAIILSSQTAAGPCEEGQAQRKEGDADAPVTWYGQSKLEMERKLAEEFPHLPYLCLRSPWILGPRDLATLPLFKMARKPVRFKPGFRSKYFSFIRFGFNQRDLCGVGKRMADFRSPLSIRCVR
jgi:nucleoside-diphosphate-sugar epimerase